jgi:translin
VDLSDLGESLRRYFDGKSGARERGMTGSRDAVRSCGNAIRALHRSEIEGASGLLEDAEGHLNRVRGALDGHDDVLYAGFVHDAEKELAEARITFALVTDAAIPTPEEIGVPPPAYLKGMAESIGELRRHILDLMRKGELKRCEQLLQAMDDIYYLLVTMDYPDGLTYGLRRLTDIARSIIERTRGDLTTSMIQSSLRNSLERHQSSLDARGDG